MEAGRIKIRGPLLAKMRNRIALTQRELALKVGMSETRIRHIEGAEETGVFAPTFRKLAEVFGETVDSLRLRLGSAETAQRQKDYDEAMQAAFKLKPAIDERDKHVNARHAAYAAAATKRVPIINKIPAGYLIEKTDLGYPPGIADDYIDAPVGQAQAFALWVEGDSMSPRYESGDLVIFRLVDLHHEEIEHGADYAICYNGEKDGETTFKRLFIEKKQVIGRPINKASKPARIVIDLEKVARLGKVMFIYPRVAHRG